MAKARHTREKTKKQKMAVLSKLTLNLLQFALTILHDLKNTVQLGRIFKFDIYKQS